MSIGEVHHRIREQFLLRKLAPTAPPADINRSSQQQTLTWLSSKVFELVDSPEIGRRVDGLMAGTVSVLGEEFDLNGRCWERDPRTNTDWPDGVSHKIDFRLGESRDPKWSWEVNRLLFALPLSLSLNGRSADRAAILLESIVKDWVRANPPGFGVAWASSLEPAIRVIALTTFAQAYVDAGRVIPPDLALSVPQHISWLLRYPSLYSSANNHRVAEIVGILCAETAWSNLPKFDVGELERELSLLSTLLIEADGVGAEQSPTYAAFTLELLSIACCTHEWSDLEAYRKVIDRLHLGCSTLEQFTTEDGTLYRYGDDDEGKVFGTLVADQDYLRWIALISDTPLTGRKQGLLSFVIGGHSILRTAQPGSETTWHLDHAPLSYGAIAAHGHADALSLTLRHSGVDWFVDAGTFIYHGDRAQRDYFRSTAVHNTPLLNDANSSVISGSFNWHPTHRATAQLIHSVSGDGLLRIEACHNGYERLGVGKTTRTLAMVGRGEWELLDTIAEANGFKSCFLLHSACRVERTPRGWRVTRPETSSVLIIDVTNQDFQSVVSRIEDDGAWFSPAFGVKQRATRIGVQVARGESARAQIRFIFRLVDSESPTEMQREDGA